MSHTIYQPTEKPSLPPLRIHHFLLWTVALSLVMALIQAFPIQDQDPTLPHLLGILSIIPDTIALVTACLLIYWWTQGLKPFDEIGQWLLIPSFKFALNLYSAFFILLSIEDASRTIPSHVEWLFHGLTLLSIILYFYMARRIAHSQSWQIFCWVGFGWALWPAIVYGIRFIDLLGRYTHFFTASQFAFILATLVDLILIALLLIAVWKDLQSDRRFHWTHWCGVITWELAILNQLTMSLYYRLIQ